MPRVIANQPIRIYPQMSQTLMDFAKKGRPHPLTSLLAKYPGDWSKDILVLPYLMKVKIEADRKLQLDHSHILVVSKDIADIVGLLPAELHQPYQYVLENLQKPDALERMNIARVIEFLAIASCRFILDSIRIEQQSEREISLQGVVLPSYVRKGFERTNVWLFHDLGESIDPLLIDCLNLATERVKSIIESRDMDLTAILKKKCYKYSPSGSGVPPKKSLGPVRRVIKLFKNQFAELVASMNF